MHFLVNRVISIRYFGSFLSLPSGDLLLLLLFLAGDGLRVLLLVRPRHRRGWEPPQSTLFRSPRPRNKEFEKELRNYRIRPACLHFAEQNRQLDCLRNNKSCEDKSRNYENPITILLHFRGFSKTQCEFMCSYGVQIDTTLRWQTFQGAVSATSTPRSKTARHGKYSLSRSADPEKTDVAETDKLLLTIKPQLPAIGGTSERPSPDLAKQYMKERPDDVKMMPLSFNRKLMNELFKDSSLLRQRVARLSIFLNINRQT